MDLATEDHRAFGFRWLVLVAALAAGACGEAADDVTDLPDLTDGAAIDNPDSTIAVHHADTAESTVDGCRIEAEEILIAVALDAHPGEPVDVAADGVLALRITNRSPRAGTVTVTAHDISAQGEHDHIVASASLPASGTAVVPAHLTLPSTPLDFSGSLRLEARLAHTNADGDSNAVRLFFHPTSGGWLVYDLAARQRLFSGGALTGEARVQQQQERADATSDARGEVGGAFVEILATNESYRPESDLHPADH